MTTTQTIGICGIGQMGAAAAVAFQRAGYRVLLWARNPDKLNATANTLAKLSSWSTEHLGPAKRAGGEILREPNLTRLDAEADVVLDCILEVMEQKSALFRQFTGAAKRDAAKVIENRDLQVARQVKFLKEIGELR